MGHDTTLLLVDDHAVIRKGLRHLLEAEGGFRVVAEAGDGREAIERVRETRPDVVVMDITMPNLNGIEATRAILAEAPATRVLTLSVHATKSFVRDMLEAGASGYLLKQSAPEELVTGIRGVMAGEVFLGEGVQDLVISDYLENLSEERAPALTPTPLPILTTKLHRPPVSPGYQPRPRLLDLMNRSLQVTMTLISAPAGYGKSTLASAWLDQCACPTAWVSLDEEENAPRSFLTLLVAAIQIRFPDIGRATMALASASEFPDISHIQRQLVNDLDEIDEPFVLVLEDLHLVQDQRVMELLAGLLHHPPRHLHLMVLTRWDPVLPLGTLRAQGQLLEIGLDALRFTVEETTRYLDTVLGEEVDRKDAEALERSTEGWVTGIRLAALSIRDGEELARLVKRMEGSLEFISSYLMEEVLSGLPAPERSFLLQTSILDRFSGDLCDALWIPEGEGAAADEGEGAGNAGAAGETMRGEAFLDWAKKNQLFVVPLDLEGQWFRYHHLFQSLLQAELRQRSTPEKITRLHLRASRWLADNDLPDEAIRHALAGGDVDAAVKVVEENRISLLDKGQWTKLSDWLGLLPQEVKDTRPHLLLARAWVADFRGRADEILPVLERLDGMVKAEKLDRTSLTETSLWRGYLEFWTGQPEASRRTLEGALCNAREMPDMVRAMAEVYSAFSIQATGGDIPKVIHRIRKLTAPNSDSGPLLKTRASLASVFVHLLSGQLKEAFHTGSRVRTLAAETDDSYVYLWSCYLRGNVAFHWFPADECCRLLGEVWQNRFNLERRAAADSMAALALSHQFLRCPSEAREVLRHAEEFAEWTRDPAVKERMASAHARIALLQGDLNRASAWEEAFEATPSSGEAVFWMENPFLTQCRVLLAQGSPENWLKALEQLRHLDDLYSLYHNECQRIEIGVLEAAALQKLGRGEEAVGSLTQVLGRAAPGRWIRPFVELGPPMAELLEEVRDRDVAVTQIQEILAAFQTPIPQEAADIEGAGPGHPKMASGVGQLLTEREVDVLFQLAKGYSNKAIARNLHLSVETVKKHLYNAFKKLNVNNRVAALAKAKELGLPFDE